MSKDAVFTLKLQQDLRDEFVAAAQAADRPASQIVRELMREYVDRQEEERAYLAFVHEEVALARAEIAEGKAIPAEVVEAEFAALRARARSIE